MMYLPLRTLLCILTNTCSVHPSPHSYNALYPSLFHRTITNPYPPLSTPIHPYPPLSTLIHPYPPLSTPIHPYPPLSTPIHPYPPLSTLIHPYPPLSIPAPPGRARARPHHWQGRGLPCIKSRSRSTKSLARQRKRPQDQDRPVRAGQ